MQTSFPVPDHASSIESLTTHTEPRKEKDRVDPHQGELGLPKQSSDALAADNAKAKSLDSAKLTATKTKISASKQAKSPDIASKVGSIFLKVMKYIPEKISSSLLGHQVKSESFKKELASHDKAWFQNLRPKEFAAIPFDVLVTVSSKEKGKPDPTFFLAEHVQATPVIKLMAIAARTAEGGYSKENSHEFLNGIKGKLNNDQKCELLAGQSSGTIIGHVNPKKLDADFFHSLSNPELDQVVENMKHEGRPEQAFIDLIHDNQFTASQLNHMMFNSFKESPTLKQEISNVLNERSAATQSKNAYVPPRSAPIPIQQNVNKPSVAVDSSPQEWQMRDIAQLAQDVDRIQNNDMPLMRRSTDKGKVETFIEKIGNLKSNLQSVKALMNPGTVSSMNSILKEAEAVGQERLEFLGRRNR